MNTIIANEIRIQNPTQNVLNWCRENLILTNPEYSQMKRLGKEDLIKWKHIDEKIALFAYVGNEIRMPFGCLSAIFPLIKNYPYETRFNNAGSISYKNDKIQSIDGLYDYQEDAVRYLQLAKNGILSAGCSAGKTIMGWELVKRIGKKALWICHTSDLLRQAKQDLLQLYPNAKIGITTEGKVDIGEDITISTVQTLVKVDPALYQDKFDVVIVDECMPGNVKIATPFGYKALKDISNGDIVYSYGAGDTIEKQPVTHLFKHVPKDLYKIKLCNEEEIICTGNHPIYVKDKGYIPASKVTKNDYVMQLLQQQMSMDFDWIRVDNNTIQEQTIDGTFGGLCPDGFVYNIEVAVNNNYFANNYLVHNCHHCVSSPSKMQMFGKVLSRIPARYKFGLTATPYRADGMTKAMYAYIGLNVDGLFKPTFEIDESKLKKMYANHERVDINSNYSSSELMWKIYDSSGMLDYNSLINELCSNNERTEKILKNIVKCKEEGRKQVVLSMRVEHCEYIVKRLQELGVNAYLCVGKVTNKKRDEILNQKVKWDVIVATYQLLKEGISIKELDTLHLTGPAKEKGLIKQCAGRIERYKEGKKQPIIYDYVDVDIPYCENAYKQRKSALRRKLTIGAKA